MAVDDHAAQPDKDPPIRNGIEGGRRRENSHQGTEIGPDEAQRREFLSWRMTGYGQGRVRQATNFWAERVSLGGVFLQPR